MYNYSILGAESSRKYLIFHTFLVIAALVCGWNIFKFSDSDQAALDSLLEAGSDFTKIRPFDFYLYHPEASGAEQICAQLRSKGFQAAVREGAVESEWLCLASLDFLPSTEKLSELQSLFDDLISQNGGEYDGWETILIPR